MPSNDKYLVVLDRTIITSLQQFIQTIALKFKLNREFLNSGFFIRETNGQRILDLSEIQKEDQFVIMNNLIFQKNNTSLEDQLSYYDIFGVPKNLQNQRTQGNQRTRSEPSQFSYHANFQHRKCQYYYTHWAYDQKYSELEGYKPSRFGVPPPRKLRERFDYLNADQYDMWIESPDFLPYANDLEQLKNREELIQTIKRFSLERGFKLILPYGQKSHPLYIQCAHYQNRKPESKQAMICHRSGKKKSQNSKKSHCPFSLIFKKHNLGDDPRVHPAYNDSNGEQFTYENGIGVYYLSKFRALHNHPIDLSAIHTEAEQNEDFTVLKRKCEETSLAYKYHQAAFEQMYNLKSPIFKITTSIFEFKEQFSQAETLKQLLLYPESGVPQIIIIQEETDFKINLKEKEEVMDEQRQVIIDYFEKVFDLALIKINLDYPFRKPSIYEQPIHQNSVQKNVQQSQSNINSTSVNDNLVITIYKSQLENSDVEMNNEEEQNLSKENTDISSSSSSTGTQNSEKD